MPWAVGMQRERRPYDEMPTAVRQLPNYDIIRHMKNVAKDIHKSVGKLTLAALAVIAVQTVCGQAVRCSEPVTTASLQATIDRVSKSGGGRVEVPAGTWTIGTVWLRSGDEHCNHLEQIARI